MTRVEAKRTGSEVSERVSKLREKMLVPPEVCIERAYWMTESYKETESEEPIIRRAKSLAKILTEMTIGIEDGELIVGRITSKRRGGVLVPELQWEWYLKEMDSFSTRDFDRFAPLTEDERKQMKEFLPYWKGNSLYEKWLAMVPKDAQRLGPWIQATGYYCANNWHYAHMGFDDRVLTKGLNGIKKQVDEQLGKLDIVDTADFERFQFLSAVKITIEAAKGFAKRYAELARNMAEKEKDAQRKAELQMIAKTCDWVPANPARTFYEALQSIWFMYVVLMVEGWGGAMSFGRLDQYLYPFYKKDTEEGRITKEEARELIALLYIKTNGAVTVQAGEVSRVFSGFAMWPCFTLGGLTKEGKDAVNELSYLFLDAETDVRLNEEELVIRIHKNTPDAFLMRALEIAKLLRGKLKFVSDETIILQLLTDGKPIERARDYIIAGCTNPTIPSFSHDHSQGQINLPLMLELALNNGASRLTGEQLGPKTGDPRKFKSYDEVWNAYKKQVEALVPIILLFKNVDQLLYAKYCPTPFQSALFPSCIETGIDITNGGTAPYRAYANTILGLADVADSLAALKKVVFDDGKITIGRLIDTLDKNFEGEEELQNMLKSTPKYGNDNDYVDSIANQVLVHVSNENAKHKGLAGAISSLGSAVIASNILLGRTVGALPDGRKASEPLTEGGVSPHQGRNVSGPTATMRSIAKLDHTKMTNGSVLNLKFNPDALKDESKMRRLASIMRTYFETGGPLVQFNIVSTDMLKDAQVNPEKYRDLLVRVATYSAKFVELSKEIQDDIIARIEFQEV